MNIMSGNVIGLTAVAVIGGCAVALQGQFMGVMERSVGTTGGIFINYASGAVLAIVLLVTMRDGHARAWLDVPWYALTAGVLGLVIAGSIGYTASRLGLTTAFTIIVATQFIVSLMLDHFGWLGATARPADLTRLLGVCAIIGGVWLTSK
ncbi:DMT family transporter [Paraburkholderia sediminicola]|jgi:transporter family-2 protein|uniref:DMT family transporter n=2 Tax=Paraburkholderia sediminicola TaxID=458836 RepID=UPI0020B148FA